jgi:hypothetical protein
MIHTAYGYGLISGFADGTFRPDDKITREQAMVIRSKAAEITGLKDHWNGQPAETVLQPFKDAEDLSSWARGSIAEAVQHEGDPFGARLLFGLGRIWTADGVESAAMGGCAGLCCRVRHDFAVNPSHPSERTSSSRCRGR